MKLLKFYKKRIIFSVSIIIMFTCFFLAALCIESRAENTIPFTEEIQSPRDLAKWLGSNFKYVFRLNDKWQTPSETINLRAGDCEDFATLASSVLRGMGIKSDIVIIKFRGLDLQHAVCIWREENGKYSYFSNRKLVLTNRSTLQEAIQSYYPDLESLTFTDQKGTTLKVAKR